MTERADDLLDQAERRWHQLTLSRPELADAIELQRVLVTRTSELQAGVQSMLDAATARPADLLPKLSRGDGPVLDFAIELDVERIQPFLVGFCDDFAAGGAGDPARRVRRMVDTGALETASLLRASLLRQQDAIRTRAIQLGVSPDLVWLVAELSVSPIAHHVQHETLVAGEAAEPAIIAAAGAWPRGSCPACGSWPAFIELRDGRRHLRCSFCGADWCPPAAACVYCARDGQTWLTAGRASRPGGRVEFCRACGGYLKQLDVAGPTPFLLLPVLDLESTDLDRDAVARGYGRPSMPATGTNMPCPPGSP